MRKFKKFKSKYNKRTFHCDRHIIQDKTLSVNARYIYAWARSSKDCYHGYNIIYISNGTGIERHAVSKAMEELVSHKYALQITNDIDTKSKYFIFLKPDYNRDIPIR